MNIRSSFILMFLFLGSFIAYSQGLINNGAAIVFNGATPNIYIDGANGNYTSQNGGTIVNQVPMITGPAIILEGNWINNSSNTAFSNDGITTILNGANQSIGGSSQSSFYHLTLSGTGTKTLNINTSAGGISTLTGVLSLGTRPLDLNGNTLTITNPAASAITYSTGYIQSETNAAFNSSIIQWNMGTSTGAHVYPFGVAGTQIPFTFNKTTPGSANISVSTRSTSISDNTPWSSASNVGPVVHMYDPTLGQDGSDEAVIDRWWDITASAAVTANLTFSYRGVENTMDPAYQTASLGAQHWSGTSWDPPVGSGTGVITGVGTVTVTGASTFSPWVISSSLAPLPIELLHFDAACTNDEMVIRWATATETNNDYFTVEKSFDGQEFVPLSIVDGAGNSTGINEYAVTDNSFTTGTAYYRLKQTDYDGKFTYSPLVSAEGCGSYNNWLYATMAGDALNVVFSSSSEENYTIMIFDVAGRKIAEEAIVAEEGINRIKLSQHRLSSGVYLITLRSSSHMLSTKAAISR